MNYSVIYSDEAKDDLKGFSKFQARQIRKMIDRVSQNPLPKNEGGYGNPLGNKGGLNLTGLCKITFKKLAVRVVYQLVRADKIMQVIVIAARADEEVYEIAAKRIKK